MAYKVTISDGTILEKSIESVTFKADPPPDNSYCMRTYTINSMTITGRIGSGEKTISLYEWSLLPANNPDCYKEIVVEQTHTDQTVRVVKFSKAFVVDYSESYSKGEGLGLFSIIIRQLAGVDIELTNEITPQPAMTETSNEVEELSSSLVQSAGIAATSSIAKKNRPNFTDILAKKKMIQDNGNAGVGNGAGNIIGSLDGLTAAEKKVINDLILQGKNVEIITKTTASKTPDFLVNGIKTELKTLENPNINTGITRIQKGFKQGAETVIIDGREAGLTVEQANLILNRATGTYSNKALPGKVEIWINGGIIGGK